jgi:hypothetical protein
VRRVLLAVVAGTIVFATVYGAAASLMLTSADLGSGDVVVSKCDPNSFTVDGYTINASNQITDVQIGDIAPACIGGELTVTLTDATNVELAAGSTAAVTSPTTTVSVTPFPNATAVKKQFVIVVGP